METAQPLPDSLVVPNHIGFIVDGNRRWAKQRGLPTLEGHKRGFEALMEVVEECFTHGVSVVSAYVFSTENWSRSAEEVAYLMKLFEGMFSKQVKTLHQNGIRVVFLGSRTYKVSPKLVQLIEEAEALTANNTKGTLALCFNYGGQLEIAEAVQKIIAETTQNSQNVVGGGVTPTNVTPELIAEHLYHPEIPPVDFMIRTSGEQRISNFMLWRVAYAEMLFLDKNWPDMTRADVAEIIANFSRRQRRFGGN
jgi:undecaprenyl diphosphate synthase